MALGSTAVAPAPLSSLPRRNRAEARLPLGWRVEAGEHGDRAEGGGLSHYCWAQVCVCTK